MSAGIWLLSAALATWGTPRQAILILVIGGMFIFPFTSLVLRLTGGRASLPAGHPMNYLAMQIAFTVPLMLPLVGAATLHRLTWFYPSFMIVVGAHYLPFTFLYGTRLFIGLCAVLVGGGLAFGLWMPGSFAVGGWLTSVALIIADAVGRVQVGRERAALALQLVGTQ